MISLVNVTCAIVKRKSVLFVFSGTRFLYKNSVSKMEVRFYEHMQGTGKASNISHRAKNIEKLIVHRPDF